MEPKATINPRGTENKRVRANRFQFRRKLSDRRWMIKGSCVIWMSSDRYAGQGRGDPLPCHCMSVSFLGLFSQVQSVLFCQCVHGSVRGQFVKDFIDSVAQLRSLSECDAVILFRKPVYDFQIFIIGSGTG